MYCMYLLFRIFDVVVYIQKQKKRRLKPVGCITHNVIQANIIITIYKYMYNKRCAHDNDEFLICAFFLHKCITK